jgi:preprotein translocase subunit SecE
MPVNCYVLSFFFSSPLSKVIWPLYVELLLWVSYVLLCLLVMYVLLH